MEPRAWDVPQQCECRGVGVKLCVSALAADGPAVLWYLLERQTVKTGRQQVGYHCGIHWAAFPTARLFLFVPNHVEDIVGMFGLELMDSLNEVALNVLKPKGAQGPRHRHPSRRVIPTVQLGLLLKWI